MNTTYTRDAEARISLRHISISSAAEWAVSRSGPPHPKATTRKETDHLPKRKCLAVIPGLGTKNEIQLPCYETKLFSFSPTKGRSFIWRQERLLTMVVPNRNYELKTIIIIYQAVRRFHIFLRPLNTYSIFFLHSSLSFQSSSNSPFSPHQSSNPFRPSEFRSTSFPSSWWVPFHSLFWESSLFHSLNTSIPFQLISVNIV